LRAAAFRAIPVFKPFFTGPARWAWSRLGAALGPHSPGVLPAVGSDFGRELDIRGEPLSVAIDPNRGAVTGH
jgi:hypothetical protein